VILDLFADGPLQAETVFTQPVFLPHAEPTIAGSQFHKLYGIKTRFPWLCHPL